MRRARTTLTRTDPVAAVRQPEAGHLPGRRVTAEERECFWQVIGAYDSRVIQVDIRCALEVAVRMSERRELIWKDADLTRRVMCLPDGTRVVRVDACRGPENRSSFSDSRPVGMTSAASRSSPMPSPPHASDPGPRRDQGLQLPGPGP